MKARLEEPLSSGRCVLLIATIVRSSPQALPFETVDASSSYGHLAGLCAERGYDLCVTHYDNCSGSKVLAWAWQNGSWHLTNLPLAKISLCYADLPDSFPGAKAFRRALESRSIPVVNALRLSDLLTDKLATHDFFEEHVPLTLRVDLPDLVDRLRDRRLHPDLSTGKLFLKPRYGERGKGLYVTDLAGLPGHPALGYADYILQAFLETRDGIPELGIHCRHDLRLIVCDGQVVLAFVRLPTGESLVSNCSQGGREVPLSVRRLPARIIRFACSVDARLQPFGPRLYSLDLGIGRTGKIWIYELNTMPGIVWDDLLPANKPLHQKMHRILANWLGSAWNRTHGLRAV